MDEEDGICWLRGPEIPWDAIWFLTTVRGVEYIHLYLWLIKG